MRLVLICLGLVVSLLCTPPAMAQSYRDRVIQSLTDQGFSNFRVRRTWLGYDQIIALGPDGRREVVLNPSTGAILRDYLYTSDVPRSRSVPLAHGSTPPAKAADAGGTAPPDASPDADPPDEGAPGQQDKDGPPGQADKDGPPGQEDKDDPPGQGDKGDPPGRSDDKPGADPPGRDGAPGLN
ncbi:hypothetical protein KZZ07_21530 [Mameliella sp. CS4]|uniref:hypothetical protein n=1 Tax=Mameliella sp. CS4 TaxID=2862329 RepID=UPI001C5F25BF|nr:hypothetical protein [Mameliella sp. CS4]MBW4985130.1 hypothetical protein [Mameliella sp. CS4]